MKLPGFPILSDLDGTLIDSKAAVVAAFRWWAESRELATDIALRIPFGRTSADAARALAPHLDHEREGAILDERQQQETEGVVALDGAMELLSSHQPLAVVTSCPRALALARLRAAQLPAPSTLVTPECWSRGKPDPEPYLLGAQALGVPPESCFVLEDSPSGVESGVRAGMRVIGLLTSHTAHELSGASYLIRSLRELPDALRMIGAR